MKTCPTCQRVYEDRAKFCPQDGTALVSDIDPLTGQTFDGRYKIEAFIGAGRAGRVYRARHVLLDELVALKVFTPELARDAAWAEQLRDYARRAARLNHSHIVAIDDLNTDASGQPYMVMRYFAGRALARELQTPGRFTRTSALDLLAQIASALDLLHRAGISYGPLRPTDVLYVDSLSHVKLLPPSFRRPPAAATQFDDDAYAAPELGRGELPPELQGRADIYSLAVICYELLTGRKPYDAQRREEIQFKHQRGARLVLPELGPDAGAEVGRLRTSALAPNPYERPATATELIAQLSRAASVKLITRDQESSPAAPAAPADASESGAEAHKPLYTDENVQFTVYQPEAVAPARWYTLLAFAHLSKRRADAPTDEPDPIAEVARLAARVLADQPTDYDAVRQQSLHAVPHKSLLTFIPFVEGVEFNPPSQSFNWQKSVHKVEFELRAAASLGGQVARGRLSVFIGALLLADVPLALRVDGAHRGATRAQPSLPTSASPYRNIFASYSHHDREIVEHIEHYVQTLGDKYLRDVTALRAGEDWQRWMKEAIEAADVFQLFWSRNSMRSAYVRAEWEHALSLGRENFVRPVYWETPLPESPAEDLPPPVLRKAHFQHLQPGASTHAAVPGGASSAPEQTASSLPDFNARGAPPMQEPPLATTVATTPQQNQLACERCGATNPSDQLFCLHCGSSLVPTRASYSSPPESRGGVYGTAAPSAAAAGSDTAASIDTRRRARAVDMEQRPKGVKWLWAGAGALLLLVCLLIYLLLR